VKLYQTHWILLLQNPTGLKEATLSHYEDLLKAGDDASINSTINAAYKILEKK
jgi:hypothetical protein